MSAAVNKIHRFLTPFVVFLITSFVTLACNQQVVFSGSGLLSSVGGATFIQGTKQFWVTSSMPTFSGITTPSTNVDVTINGVTSGSPADASGNWSYTPTTELSGENEVTVANATESMTFTLTIGDLPESIASAGGSTLAPAGSISPTILVSIIGLSTVALGLWGLNRSRRT